MQDSPVGQMAPGVESVSTPIRTGWLVRVLTEPAAIELAVATSLVALLIRLPYIVGPVWGTRFPDSEVYLAIAHHHWFAHGVEMRTPAYPLLLVALSPLPGGVVRDTVILQHLVGAAMAGVLAWSAWRFFGRGAALLTAGVAVLSPVFVDTEGEVLPDFLLAAVVLVGAILLAEALARRTPSMRLLIAAGACFGLAAEIKPVGQILLATALLPLVAYSCGWKHRVRAGLALLIAGLALMAPWLARNEIDYGDLKMSVQDGPALWLREFDYDHRPIPTGSSDDALALKLYRATVDKPPVNNTYEFVLEALESPPYDWSERRASAFQRRVALQAIEAAPGVYIRGTGAIDRAFIRMTPNTLFGRVDIAGKSAHTPPLLPTFLSRVAFSAASTFMWLWWIASLALFSVFLLLIGRNRRRRAGVVALGACYLLVITATAATTYPDYRYATQAVALLWVLGSAGAAMVISALWAQVRSLRAGAGDEH